jgi:hypothetical protein
MRGESHSVLPVTLKPDPPVRPDDRCAVCCEPKLTANQGPQRPTHLERIAGDPFCSAVCARAYHGVEASNEREQQVDTRAA